MWKIKVRWEEENLPSLVEIPISQKENIIQYLEDTYGGKVEWFDLVSSDQN